ncbi:hypothetical protein [Chenggangzhangella methanolivorans]|uniref:Uncharacterized protein n=1 Tax=Chenggangzhangella methanolivorans TaxID=1437009 RepID=A0A9E6RDR8_9HYPH|nr:hypothetical protein [Chenggangzhangella methanolivorans]QZO02562.1 hypothetical protein K6K41_25580 [Chenggangzhangella methanolivorans]
MRDQNGDTIPKGGEHVADYIAGMSRDLSALARRNRLTTLAYLLEMAGLEAETIAREGDQDDTRRAPSDEGVDAS